MAVAYSSIASTAYSTRVNSTCTKPTVSTGDLMVAFLVHGGASIPAVTPPAGWTEYTATTTTSVTDGSFNLRLRFWWRVVDGSEGANFTWTHASASAVIAILAFTGAHTTAPIGAFSQNFSTGTPTVADSTYLTITPTAGAANVTVGFDWADTAANLVAPSGTPTLTERYDGVVLYIATADNVAATATGSRTQANNANSGSPWYASQIAIEPAGAAAAIANKKLIIEKQALVRASYW